MASHFIGCHLPPLSMPDHQISQPPPGLVTAQCPQVVQQNNQIIMRGLPQLSQVPLLRRTVESRLTRPLPRSPLLRRTAVGGRVPCRRRVWRTQSMMMVERIDRLSGEVLLDMEGLFC